MGINGTKQQAWDKQLKTEANTNKSIELYNCNRRQLAGVVFLHNHSKILRQIKQISRFYAKLSYFKFSHRPD